MKKILTVVVALLLTMPVSARMFVYNYEGQRLTYNVTSEKDRTCEVAQSNYVSGDVKIPEIAKDDDDSYTVTAIAESAFANCGVKSIEIPESVTTIGRSAFEWSALKSVTIPASVSVINDNTFHYCMNLTTVKLSDNTKSIGEGAFFECDQLSSVYFGKSLESIGKEAFLSCHSLSSVELPPTLTTLGESAFSWCYGIKSIKLPDKLKEIGKSAFYINQFTSIVLPPELESIGDLAFAETPLSSVMIPASVSKLSGSSFSMCYSLNEINVDPANPTYTSKDGMVYDKEMSTLVTCPAGREECVIADNVIKIGPHAFEYGEKLQKVVIPESLEEIGYCAFFNCSSLKSVIFSGNSRLLEIGGSAFDECKSLQSIDIPYGVTNIKSGAFYECRSLSKVSIPETVTKIGSLAFASTSIKTLTIPSKIEEIGVRAFLCGAKDVYYNTTNPLNLHYDEIFSTYSLPHMTLYVAPGGVETAKKIHPWCDFGKIVEFDFSSVDEIVDGVNPELPMEIFTLDGMPVSGSVDSLASGIYILRQGASVKKISVR